MSDIKGERGFAFDEAAYGVIQNKMSVLEKALPETAIRALAEEIVERLASRRASEASIRASASPEKIDEFVEILLRQDADEAKAYIQHCLTDGIPLDRLYYGLLAGAAQELGVRWTNDRLSFLEVNLATGLIYAIMRGLSPLFEVPDTNTDREAIFAALPGEDHTLGVVMAADIFRQAGWTIDLKVGLDLEQLVDSCTRSGFLILGVSASNRKVVLALVRFIIAVRFARPDMFIMVAGNIVALEPNILTISGADAVARDLDEALAILNGRIPTNENDDG